MIPVQKLKTEDVSDEKKVSISIEVEEEEKLRAERKKRTQEDMVADFVKILEQMMNPRQAVTSLISVAIGIATVIVASLYVGNLPPTALKAKNLVVVMMIYGIIQFFLAGAFFMTCMQTTIAVSKGVKDALQIILGLLVALVYVSVTLISFVVGIFGFYKTLCIVSFVEFDDTESQFYCPSAVFYTALTAFILHIVLIVAKCCCCK